MKIKVIIVFLFVISKISAQEVDTLRIKSIENLKSTFNAEYRFNMNLKGRKRNNNIFNAPYSKFIIPAALITYGVASQFDKSDDYEIHNEVTKNGIGEWIIDDYAQFAPAVAVYGVDLMGIKAKHNFRDRTIIMATSHIIMGGIVQTMKSTINVGRPNIFLRKAMS